MQHRPRTAFALLLALALVAGCAPAAPAAAPAPTSAPTTPPAPTAAPSPTPAPAFAAGSTIFGVDVAGLTLEEAREQLAAALADLPESIELRAGPARLPLPLEEIGLAADPEELLAEAATALAAGDPVALAPALDEEALREQLAALAAEVAVPPEITVITGTEVLSRSFAYRPGRSLDLDAAYEQLAEAIGAGALDEPLELALTADEAAPRVPLEQLQAEVEALAEEWDGVVGFHLHDLASGETAALNDKTVFAGASTIKVAVMLYLYMSLEELSERQEFWLGEMIRFSDNLSANDLLAAAAGGTGTDWAFVGADAMSTMLQEQLGLEHTYLYVPYETTDYIKLYKPSYRCGPQGRVGEPPYTEMGACLRATPYSMAQIYRLIDECAAGEGLLLDEYEKLSPERCQEMLDWLARNADKTRMVAGIPEEARGEVRVEHKSGWIEDMNADVGIVRSPGGDYVLAVYAYKPLDGRRDFWPDEVMAPVVAAFSHLAYTAYNPILLDAEEQP